MQYHVHNRLLCVFIASIGSLMNGLDSGIITTTLEHPQFFEYFFDSSVDTRPNIEGLIVSMMSIGSVIGTLLIGPIADKISRKRAIGLLSTITLVGVILETASVNLTCLMIGRFIAGLGIGMGPIAISTYASEIALPQERARLVGIQGCLRSCGYTLASWIGYASAFDNSGQGTWRIPFACQIPLAVALIIGSFILPYSPRWLMEKDRHDEALEVLTALHSKKGREFAVKEYIQIREQIALERSQQKHYGVIGSIRTLFSKRYLRRTLTVLGVQLANGLTGAGVAASYQSILFGDVGFTGKLLLLVSACYGFMGPTFSLLNILFIADRWGRRETCYIGAAVLAIDLSIIMAITANFSYNKGDTHSEAIASVAFIFLFSGLYSISFENTPNLICAEILPYFLRTMGFGLSNFLQGCVGILISQLTPIIFDIITWKFYAIFIFTNFVAAIVYYFFLPETKGLSLEEVGLVFGSDLATEKLTQMESSKARELALDMNQDTATSREKAVVTMVEDSRKDGVEP